MPKATEQIREARRSKGLTQLQLACRAGVASRTVQMVEAGQEVSLKTIRQLAETLGIDPESAFEPESAVRSEDAFLELPWSIGQFLKDKFFPTVGSICRDESEVREVVQLLRDHFCDQIKREGDAAEQARFLEIDSRLNAAYFRYEQRYLELWHEVPEAIQVDRIEEAIAGVSIVVPLKEESFQAFVRGETSFIDLRAEDILPQSQYVLLDSVTEFPGAGRRPWYQMTRSLSFITFSQIAALSEAPKRDDFAMASFSASRTNLKRLEAVGFELAGSRMPELEYDILRFGAFEESGELEAEVQRSAMSYFSHLTKRIASVDLKKSSIKRMLQMIKQRQLSRCERGYSLQNAG